ncbi:MAG: hypothetical protein Crog4KO_35500 [Crocinitomicaceae bacterium]
MSNNNLIPRLLVFVSVILTLLAGMGSGLARLGWQMDSLSSNWILIHGPLMIGGFLGTLLCMERAVALASRYPWAIAVPIINALGAFALLILPNAILAKLFLTTGSIGLLALFGIMLRLHPSKDVLVMALGALCWVVGNVLWVAGTPIYQVVHLWIAFLVLTIVGERLELSRVRRLTPRSEQLFILSVSVYLLGVSITIFNLDIGIRLLGVGAILMTLWLLRYDIARRTILQTGLTRYIAACLLSGYVWLAFGGLMAVWKGAVYASFDYSLILHAFLLGFVFSMIFGHMPIILPALTNLKITYTPFFYGHLILLHITLIVRTIGNLSQSVPLRQWGGLFNVLTILIFTIIIIVTVIRSNRPTLSQQRSSSF